MPGLRPLFRIAKKRDAAERLPVPNAPRRKTRQLGRFLLGTTAMALLLAGLGRETVARWGVERAAKARKLELAIGGLELGFLRVTMHNVKVSPEGVPGVVLVAGEVDAPLSLSLRPTAISVRQGSLTVTGKPSEVISALEKWRAGGSPPSEAPRAVLPVTGEVAVHWLSEPGAAPLFEVNSVAFERNGGGASVVATGLSFLEDGVRCESPLLQLQFDPSNHLTSVVAARADVVLKDSGKGATGAEVDPKAAGAGGLDGGAVRATAVSEPDAGSPSVVRDGKLSRAIAGMHRAASLLAPAGEVRVAALSLRVDRSAANGGEGDGIQFGEGRLRVTRTDDLVAASYSSGLGEKKLALSLTVPLAGGNVLFQLEGGPMTLAELGVEEGAFDLLGVGQANVVGKGGLVIDSETQSISFDGSFEAHDLSVNNPRLANDPVTGLHFHMAARGAVEGPTKLRIDDASLAIGALRISGGGLIEKNDAHLALTLHAEAPKLTCRELLASIPPSLVPTLSGLEVEGMFSAKGELRVDSDKLDDLLLHTDVVNSCQATAVPPPLERERFEAPFTHRIYLADGGVGEAQMGPGTDSWQPLDAISPYMQVAVRTTEDGAFPRHHGFSAAAIRGALIANLKAKRFVRGASTISMQLAKNLFLTRDKTLARKLEEILLTDYLEKTFTKRELMELYLNLVEFGPDIYGVTQAADYYFGRTPKELTLSESLFLATRLPSPLRLSAAKKDGTLREGSFKYLMVLARIAKRFGMISETEQRDALAESVVFYQGGDRPAARAAVHRPADAPALDNGEGVDLERPRGEDPPAN